MVLVEPRTRLNSLFHFSKSATVFSEIKIRFVRTEITAKNYSSNGLGDRPECWLLKYVPVYEKAIPEMQIRETVGHMVRVKTDKLFSEDAKRYCIRS